MTSAVKATLYHDRRRLALVALLAFLAGTLFYWPSQVYLGQVHISLVTGIVYAAVVFVAALIVCVTLPRMRFMIEAVALSRLLLSLLVLAVPELGVLVLTNPVIMALVVVGGVRASAVSFTGASSGRPLSVSRLDRRPDTRW